MPIGPSGPGNLAGTGLFAARPRCLAAALLLTTAAGCARDGDAPPASVGGRPNAPASATTTSVPTTPTTDDTATAGESAGSGAASGAASGAPAAGKVSGLPPDLNVLLITIDSLRADMPWSGYGRDIAPVLTAFEKKAVSYTRAYSISSYTSMSLGGLLGGRYPGELERSGYFFGNYPDTVQMFPELLQKAGVRTVSAHAHFYFDQKAGFRQGFDVYKIIPGISADNTTDRNVTSPQHLEMAKEMLGDKANTGGRFFAWFHFLDPHDIYMKHEGTPQFGKKDRDKYDGEVHFTDQHVGKLLEFVNQQDWGKRTAVIVSADHGEAFGEKRMTRHGFELWEVLVHVPLMIQAPGITPRRIDTPRSAIDLPPTMFEMLGAPAEPSFQGTSLVPELYGKEPQPRDVIVDLPRTSDNDRRRALVWGNYKLIAFGDDFGFELYDVVADPTETKDLKRENKALFEEMKARYKAKVGTIKDVCPKNSAKLRGKEKGKRC